MRCAPDRFQRRLRTGKIESNTLHVGPGLHQRVDRRLHAGHDGGISDREAEIGRPCDPHARHPALEAIEIIDAAIGNGEGIARVRPRQHVQQQGAVGDIARQAAIDRERAHRAQKIRHHAVARLQSEHAAERRRNPDRAAAIAAGRQRHDACRHQCGRAAAGAAGRAGNIPGIARDAGQRAVGDALPSEFGRRRLAEEHGAGLTQAGDAGRILRARRSWRRLRADARRPARDMRRVLDRNRHAVERSERLRRDANVPPTPRPGAGPAVHPAGRWH